MKDTKYRGHQYDAMDSKGLSGGRDQTPIRKPKMKVIKVSIEMNGRLQFSGYFTNYPTPEELFPHIPVAHRGNADPQALIQALNPKQWVICYDPRKVVQFVSSFGVVVGSIVMEEVVVSECVGFDPRRTVQAAGAAEMAEAVA